MKIWEPMPRTVWDKDGDKWVYDKTLDQWKWINEFGTTLSLSTWDFLRKYAPVTDVRPVKVGDEVTAEEFADMPSWSIAARVEDTPFTVYEERISGSGSLGFSSREAFIRSCGDEKLTVLRVGGGAA